MKRNPSLPAVLLVAALLGACADDPAAPPAALPPAEAPEAPSAAVAGPGTLQWYGYYLAAEDERSLAGTDSYTNWGVFITDANPTSTRAASRINAMSQHRMKAVVELGLLLWCGAPTYQELCPDYQARFSAWKKANSTALTSGKVLGFIVRDEPFVNKVNLASYEKAARMVKDTFPWANMILIESANEPACPHYACHFNANAHLISTVDWIGVVKYAIHPASHAEFRAGLSNMKAKFPGRKTVYVADAYWRSDLHGAAFGPDVGYMATIMREWYDAARADPDAVMLAVFSWNTVEGAITSRYFPLAVQNEQVRIGREITGRTRKTLNPVTGYLTPVSNYGTVFAWACDPDGAWSEVVKVDVYNNGVLVGSTTAQDSARFQPACLSGYRRAFQMRVPGTLGQQVTVVAHDLDGGSVQLPTAPWIEVSWVKPASITWGQPNTLTVAGLARNGSGSVAMTWRDATVGGPWSTVAWSPTPAQADATWSNTLPVSNFCHDYQIYAKYSGATSATYNYNGLASGYCPEKARMIWIQPQSRAGFGPPGSMVVAGEATGAPAGTGVVMYWRDVTVNGGWQIHPYTAPVNSDGIWLNAIENADPTHQYAVYGKYDVVATSVCTYPGDGNNKWC